MSAPAFRPGFRFSLLDGAFLVCGGLVAVAAAYVTLELAFLALVAVLHFFLFCNVFRISRPPELLWSGVFLVCVAAHVLSGASWIILGGVILAATVLVIWLEALKESYHGILWRWLNPKLPAWWAKQNRLDDG